MFFRHGNMTKREKERLKYRWEFLRRNEEYCEGYERITKELKTGDLFCLPSESVPEWVFAFLVKWELVNLIPPQMSFEEMVAIDGKWKTRFFDYLVSECLAIEVDDDPALLEGQDLYVKAVMVDVHVNMKMSKEKILDEFVMLVDRWQDALKAQQQTFPEPEAETRQQVEQYDRYLGVYDDYRKGMSIDDLAKKHHRTFIETTGVAYARLRTKRDIESCRKLIDGGYKQIR